MTVLLTHAKLRALILHNRPIVRFCLNTDKKSAKPDGIALKSILLVFSMFQRPSMAAGRIFNMRQSIRAIFNVGSERPAI